MIFLSKLPEVHTKLKGISTGRESGYSTFFYPVVLTLLLIFILAPVKAIEIPVQWSDTVAAGDTASVCTTITISRSYPIYEGNKPYLYFYPTLDIRAVPTIQQTRNCSIKVAIEYSFNDSIWKLHDSLSVDAVIRDTVIMRSGRIKLDSLGTDSSLFRANFVRAKVTKWVAYTAADTSIVGKIYDFSVHLWLTGRY